MLSAARPKARVLLAHDHALFREAIPEMLKSEPGIEVVGQAQSCAQAADLAGETRPDVVLLDVDVPGTECRKVIVQIVEASPLSRVVVFTMSDDSYSTRGLLDLGASAYLVKKVSRQDLTFALLSTAQDEDRVLLSVPRSVIERIKGPSQKVFSEREFGVLLMMAQGMSNRQIATSLYLTEGTIKRHLHNIYSKLGVNSRAGAVRRALLEGWITTSSIT